MLRIIYGAVIINQPISNWLYLTVMSASFYMSLGKRRNELALADKNASKVRKVLKYYSYEFLDKNMYVWMTMTIAFYSLWSIGGENLIWTVPIVSIILM
ncbi:hypothetical protein, partial [Treponema sp. R6D11]